MGTRSLTAFIHKHKGPSDIKSKKDEYVVMYRHYDGYPSVHGRELAEFLLSGTPSKGVPIGSGGRHFSGIEELTAWAFVHFKQENGGIYLYPPGTRDMWEDYLYKVYWEEEMRITIVRMEMWGNGGKSLMFSGSPQEFLDAHPK